MTRVERGKLGTATFSDDGLFRYDLTREWAESKLFCPRGTGSRAVWIGLNPSTATADENDPTIRRCIGFSIEWGMTGMTMLNLFGFRATDPKDMKRAVDPVGVLNDETIMRWVNDADTGIVMCAWGAHGEYQKRADEVLRMLRDNGRRVPGCLGKTKGGFPKHPLYQPKATQPEPMWET